MPAFSEAFSALKTADARQAKVWTRGAWTPIAVACSAENVLDLLTRALADADRISAAAKVMKTRWSGWPSE
jgi:hypothetical protein